jgi:hypothetical protein
MFLLGSGKRRTVRSAADPSHTTDRLPLPALIVALPGDVEVVALKDHFLGSGTPGCDSLGSGGCACSRESDTAACDVDRASSEVVRARDATHSPVALRRAATGGNNQSRMSGK